MSKGQIAVRVPQPLLDRLNDYVSRTGASKTDVVIGAIANYLGCEDDVSLHQRVNEMEQRLTQLELLVNTSDRQ
ncbi:DNA-binding domain-containing protein [Crocosphaera sp. XPORK-15E]|uniref:DNA-binding domain-containing protein n=1 Tax=Crocosphaera sp. XPORK-15E TaxID=3110247 RepID=UPI002B2172CF|nr:DNA-binding domain-containing protein [Crocosphaera sp. XPORK-15E]MEA5536830.1 DNA-binding domain-containing protein [Crocosphaera sp. XPORK-15E]